MRIGIEAQRVFRSHKHGMDVVALQLIQALQEIDTVNDYFLFVKDDVDTTCLQETANFKVILIPSTNYILWEQIYLPYYLRKYKIDILHCTGNTAPLWSPCPFVLTLHDVIYLEARKTKNTSSLYQKLGNIYRRFLVPKIIDKACSVVTISNLEKQNISNFFPHLSKKINVIYNGVNLPTSYLDDSTAVKHNIETPFALFLANTEPRKNTPNVLRAFSIFWQHNPNFKLVITGVSREFVVKQCSKDYSLKMLRQIETPGYVPKEKLEELYSGASFFLFPSLREGFGLPILEAMAYGTPVITSTISSMPEISGNAAFLVDPESPQDIANAMKELTEDKTLAEEYRQKGFKRIQDFSWKNTAKAYQNIYLNQCHAPSNLEEQNLQTV